MKLKRQLQEEASKRQQELADYQKAFQQQEQQDPGTSQSTKRAHPMDRDEFNAKRRAGRDYGAEAVRLRKRGKALKSLAGLWENGSESLQISIRSWANSELVSNGQCYRM